MNRLTIIAIAALALSGCYAGAGGYRYDMGADPMFNYGMHLLTTPTCQLNGTCPVNVRLQTNCMRVGTMLSCY
jgi:hypothetical protein